MASCEALQDAAVSSQAAAKLLERANAFVLAAAQRVRQKTRKQVDTLINQRRQIQCMRAMCIK